MAKIKVAALQTNVYEDKMKNLYQLEKLLELPELQGADLVTLGEMFNLPISNIKFSSVCRKRRWGMLELLQSPCV